ncbi:MAG: hypothetical protein R6V46_17375 [Desulfatiglandaceae bacterium]
MKMRQGKKNMAVRVCAGWVLALVFLPVTAAPEQFSGQVFAQMQESPEKAAPEGNVLNRFGKVVGSVDVNGNIFNPYGRSVGSVDADGTIFNVSEIAIGQVNPNGDVLNQSGTVLGSVNADGEVFNRTGRRVGSVNASGNIALIGGAARLLLL